jgi:hypothetical protein
MYLQLEIPSCTHVPSAGDTKVFLTVKVKTRLSGAITEACTFPAEGTSDEPPRAAEGRKLGTYSSYELCWLQTTKAKAKAKAKSKSKLRAGVRQQGNLVPKIIKKIILLKK